MSIELAFALINPYTLSKSRTGGVIGRFISRTGLDLVGARMFGPSAELVTAYAESIRARTDGDPKILGLLADYILKSYAPNPATGAPKRIMMLLFCGENAVQKVMQVTGSLTSAWGGGDTIRDTYGDYITDDDGNVTYFEPAVLVAPTRERAEAILRLWAKYSAMDGGLLESAEDVPHGENVEKTLVLIKPDNFHFPSARPGNIIDVFSRSGLRIIGAKVHRMTVCEAEAFYGPVREVLRTKFTDAIAARAGAALQREFGFAIPEKLRSAVAAQLAPLYGDRQFAQLVKFMTGRSTADCSQEDKDAPGKEKCLALVYEGVDAVAKIRNLLGQTDPTKAAFGSVRREYGHDVMENAAHGSDSAESAERELGIVHVEDDTISRLIEEYYGIE